MFDIEEFIEEGYNPENMSVVIEKAMVGLTKCKSKEAQWLLNHLESIRDECEAY